METRPEYKIVMNKIARIVTKIYLNSLVHTRVEYLIVLQQVLQVGDAFGHQQIFEVLGFRFLQHHPIGVIKDLGKTLTNSAAAGIHKSIYHLEDLYDQKY
jgi:hypothetical protein